MIHESALILTLTLSLGAALVLGFLTERIGLSPIVGYLLAGLFVGPYTPGFVADGEMAEQFAEIGVILLMFGVGLHFHVKDLLAVRTVAVTGAICQIAVATALGTLAGRMVGWSWSSGLIFGLALSVASTVVLTRVLADNRDLHSPTGRVAVGWLIVEDIFTVIVLVLLPAIFSGPADSTSGVAIALGETVLKLAVLVAFTMAVGGRVIPRILGGVAHAHSRELFTLTVLVIALGIAVGSATLFGASMALGAFLAGMVVGQSEFSFRAASEALPMRDAFAVLFFVSVGMQFDPAQLFDAPGLLAAALGIVFIGKPLAAFGIVVLLGFPSQMALSVAAALAQIGEFSLILATVGDQLGVLAPGTTNALVAAAILTITFNPMLYRLVKPTEARLARSGLWKFFNRRTAHVEAIESDHLHATEHRAVIIGYGPIGQTVTRLMKDRGIHPVVIEMNLATVRRLHQEGLHAVYGDATRPEVLDAAGLRQATALLIAGPPPDEAAEIARLAKQVNPGLKVLARSHYLKDSAVMRSAGADEVFTGEGEVALAVTTYILEQLGSTPEQMDRERRRVRKEVVGEFHGDDVDH
jgi:CPA2 family monovalent cation:H+ antiporter-2